MNKSTSTGASFALTTAILCIMGLIAPNAHSAPPDAPPVTDGAPTEPAKAPDMTFDAANDGQTVDATVSNIFEIHLESNASTGYEWTITTQNADAIESDGPPKYVRPAKALPGAPGQQVFRFKIKSVGDTKLELHYARPWDKDTPPAKTFTLTLSVKDAATQ